jgi:tetratricopeptide (TPR) repeat protein
MIAVIIVVVLLGLAVGAMFMFTGGAEKWGAAPDKPAYRGNLREIEKALVDIPPVLDPDQPPVIPDSERVKFMEETFAKAGNPAAFGAEMLVKLGNVEYFQTKYSKARAFNEEALKLAKAEGKHSVVGVCLGNIGLAAMMQGELNAAREYLEQALAIARETKYRKGEANNLSAIGQVMRKKGVYPEALDFLNKSLVIHREIGDRLGEAVQLGNIGNIFKDSGDLVSAVKYLDQAINIHKDIGYRPGQKHLGNPGLPPLVKRTPPATAEKPERQAAAPQEQKAGHNQGLVEQMIQVGKLHVKNGKYSAAVKHFEDAMKMIGEHNLVVDMRELRESLNMARMHMQQAGGVAASESAPDGVSQVPDGDKLANQSAEVQTNDDSSTEQKLAYEKVKMGRFHYNNGRYDESLSSFEEALQLTEQFNLDYDKQAIVDAINKVKTKMTGGVVYKAEAGAGGQVQVTTAPLIPQAAAPETPDNMATRAPEEDGISQSRSGNEIKLVTQKIKIGRIHFNSGRLAEAQECFEDAMQLARQYNADYDLTVLAQDIEQIKRERAKHGA